MLRSLLFVGRTKGRVPCGELDLEPSIFSCVQRFDELGITGGLLCANSYLAHLIEGTDEAIEKVYQDCHPACAETGATLVMEETLEVRRFTKWTLVYAGGTAYVAERVRELVDGDLTADQRQARAQDMVQIMQLFAGS